MQYTISYSLAQASPGTAGPGRRSQAAGPGPPGTAQTFTSDRARDRIPGRGRRLCRRDDREHRVSGHERQASLVA
jgi:hypothetical protein